MDRKGSRKNRAQGSVTKKRKFHGNKYTDKMNSDHTSKSAKKLKSDDDFVVHNDPTSIMGEEAWVLKCASAVIIVMIDM
ncbi:hypothetical protein TKK_0018608 [Trichogramma kaykai]